MIASERAGPSGWRPRAPKHRRRSTTTGSSSCLGKIPIFHVGTSMPLAREDPPCFAHSATGWDAFISFFQVSHTQPIGDIPAHAHQHHIKRIVKAFKHTRQGRRQGLSLSMRFVLSTQIVSHRLNATEPGWFSGLMRTWVGCSTSIDGALRNGKGPGMTGPI
jgi:hypothetical protein